MRQILIHFFKKQLGLVLITFLSSVQAQTRLEPIAFGNMNTWITRNIVESKIIGGRKITLYEIGDSKIRVPQNTPYINQSSPWATSSVFVQVGRIAKGSVSVFPEKRGDGYAAKLLTHVETVKVLSLININALATGAIFLGQMIEPITGTKDSEKNVISGISFTGKPSFLQFDYKAITGGAARKIKGSSKSGKLTGEPDYAEVQIILQNRWEDAEGKIHAKRIGTGWETFKNSTDNWQNQHRVKIYYGDISNRNFYTNRMSLRAGNQVDYAKNSHGDIVPIQEEGWGSAKDKVTHLMIQFASSNGGAYTGCPGNTLWIDNVALGYQ